MSITRLFCATVYVFDKEATKTLMMNHKKLGKWLPPGGKIDPNEIPDDAAIRECFEETGVKIKLIGEVPDVQGGLVRPYGTQLNIVKPGQLEHIDLIYIAIPESSELITLNENEAEEVRWFNIQDVLSIDFNTFAGVKTWITKFTYIIKNYKFE